MLRMLLLLVLLLASSPTLAGERALDVMSFNIRCGFCESPDDINHWSRRKFLVARLIGEHSPDLVGVQEAVLYQARDLAALRPEYDWVGVGRDDGKQQGEANVVLYRRSRLELLDQQTRWLSPTPELPSKGWDAAFNRTVTILRLRDRANGREFYLLNTHFDHLGRQARAESARLILRLRASLAAELPVLVLGDFNSTRESEAYPVLTSALRDSARISGRRPRGGEATFNDFGKGRDAGRTIDFIFVTENVEVLSHRILTTRYGGRYPSDHYPVLARLRLGSAR